jgi:pyruvate/2-oxoglutarate/acetoin dehydrogenase E1 component
LMLAALEYGGPVIFLEHKLLSSSWLDWMGGSSRQSVHFDIPAKGARGPVPKIPEPLPTGKAVERRSGTDITMVSVGVGVHRALQAAENLEKVGISANVLDLRWVSPLDKQSIRQSVSKSGRLLVVDEDYHGFGLSGELAAVCLEAGLQCQYRRVCTEKTIPYARHLEDLILPNVQRITDAAQELMSIDE